MERWRIINGSDGQYSVSNRGRVRSNTYTIMQKRLGKEHPRTFPGQMLKPWPLLGYYWQVEVKIWGRVVRRCVHTLVLEAFVGECPAGMECCHEDGNGFNNRLHNLRWGTCGSNQADRRLHGTDSGGERSASAILTWKLVDKIRALKAKGMQQRAICKRYGLKEGVVSAVCRRVNWKGRSR